MAINLENGYHDLLLHRGHEIEVATYGGKVVDGEDFDPPWNVAIECMTCGEVLLDFDHPEEN